MRPRTIRPHRGAHRATLLPAGTAICLWLLCASASAALSSAPDTAAWVPVNGNVKALTKVAGTTYVGGEFTQVGKLVGPGVVYDAESELPDSSWPTIEGIVTASASDGNGGWYVAGNLDRVGEAGVTDVVHIGANHKLDTSFIPPAPPQTGTFGQVSALAVSATAVYVGGPGYLAAFSRTGGALLWSVEVERVYTLTVSGGTIYAGGIFTSVRDGETRVARDHLAAFDAATGALSLTWHPETNEAVAALAAAGSLVYAGGAFTAVNGTTVRDHLAAFNGTTGAATAWNPQLDGSALALAVGATAVYVGGQFTHVNGGTERNHAAAFKRETGAATAWNPNVDEAVYALAISGSQIVAGGNFQHVDGTTPRSYLASFNDTSGAPTAWNPSLEEFTTTLAASGSQVFVGGEFLCAGVKTRDDLFAYNEAGRSDRVEPGRERRGAGAHGLRIGIDGLRGGRVHERQPEHEQPGKKTPGGVQHVGHGRSACVEPERQRPGERPRAGTRGHDDLRGRVLHGSERHDAARGAGGVRHDDRDRGLRLEPGSGGGRSDG